MVRDLNGVGGPQSGNTHAAKNQKAQANAPAEQGKQASTPTEPAKARDSVQISAQAQALAAMEGKMKDIPDVNQKKVNDLREAINSKRYTIDPEKIAEKMLKADDDLI